MLKQIIEETKSYQFEPIKVTGYESSGEVELFGVWPHKIGLKTDGDWQFFRFQAMDHTRIEQRNWWQKTLPFSRGGCIGERDFGLPEGEQFFRWFTLPREITIYTPRNETSGDIFPRIHEIMNLGPYWTCDLG